MFFDAILTVCNDLSRSADLLVLVLVLDELEILVHLGDQAGRRRMFLGDSGVAFLQLHLWIVLVELACSAVLVFHILFLHVHVHHQVVDRRLNKRHRSAPLLRRHILLPPPPRRRSGAAIWRSILPHIWLALVAHDRLCCCFLHWIGSLFVVVRLVGENLSLDL